MPSLDGRKLKLPRRQAPSTNESLADATRDIRLQKDSSLPVYRSNAIEDDTLDLTSGEPSGSKVTAPCYQEEVKMETTPVPEDRPAETVSVEAAVQPTIASLPLAPIRKATDVTRNALSSASGNPPVRKQSKRKDYGESSFRASSDGSQELASQSSPTRLVLPSRASKRVLSITVRSEPDSHPSEQEADCQPAEKVPASTSREQPQPEIAYCPLTFCGSGDKRIKRHVALKHVPPAVKAFPSCPEEIDLQLRCLSWLVRAVLGPDASLQDAVEWMNKSGQLPEGIVLADFHDETYGEACRQLGLQPVGRFSLYPVNSPALLLFWRCILIFLTHCSRDQCEEFRKLDPRKQSLCRAQAAELSVEQLDEFSDSEFILIDETHSEDDVEDTPTEEPAKCTLPQVFDSHFHLDRSSQRIWRTTVGHTVEDLLAYSYSSGVSYKPEIEVEVVGGIIVHSEPRTYPEVNFTLEGPWRVAVGVHPLHYRELTNAKLMTLQRLLGHPKVVALGECGLDRTLPVSEWSDQEEVFARMLRLARVNQPIVIHLRGVKHDRYGLDVNGACLMLMEEYCKLEQHIHLHCFMGKDIMVRAWLRKFPNTYFGVTAAARSFDQKQVDGLRAIPPNKLLLETDAPYFPLGKAKVSTPAYLGDVAAIVAIHVDMHPPEVMRTTLQNARTLYGL